MNLIGGASTQSRGRRPLPQGISRGIFLSGHGAREQVRFEKRGGGHEVKNLLSWVVGQHGCLWGHGPFPAEIECARQAGGVPGSYGSQAEYDLAEALGEIYTGRLSSDDLGVRFFQSAGEACAAAARISRAMTGSEYLASYGYHGAGLEWAHAPNSGGVPVDDLKNHWRFEWGDVKQMEYASQGAACICIEVPAIDDIFARKFLHTVRQQCDFLQIPMILDDTVLGFRLALAGSSEYYGVKPDMVVLGKALCATGGVAALLGDIDFLRELDGGCFYSTTFGGNPGPCGAAAETVKWLTRHRGEVYGADGHLYRIGAALRDGYNALGIPVTGQPERSAFSFEPGSAADNEFSSRMIEAGIVAHRPNFPTLAHTLDDVHLTLKVAGRVWQEMTR